jgi:hypothetical protein
LVGAENDFDEEMMMAMDSVLVMAFSCLFQRKQVQRFAPLDRACKDE